MFNYVQLFITIVINFVCLLSLIDEIKLIYDIKFLPSRRPLNFNFKFKLLECLCHCSKIMVNLSLTNIFMWITWIMVIDIRFSTISSAFLFLLFKAKRSQFIVYFFNYRWNTFSTELFGIQKNLGSWIQSNPECN